MPAGNAVNANLKMSIFAETECHFSAVSIEVYTALIHNLTCRLETRQALIYQLVLGLTGENGKYNYSRAVHLYPPFFDITCSAKNYKIAPALTRFHYNTWGFAFFFVIFQICSFIDLLVNLMALVKLTHTRTAVDFAHFLRELVDIHYSHCEKIVLVMDNLNIHSIAPLYKAFEPAQARRIIQRLEILLG